MFNIVEIINLRPKDLYNNSLKREKLIKKKKKIVTLYSYYIFYDNINQINFHINFDYAV